MFQCLDSGNTIFTFDTKIIEMSQRHKITNSMIDKLRKKHAEEALTEIIDYENKKNE
jgi:hypothetical protein